MVEGNKKVVVTVDVLGNTEIDAQCFVGESCKDTTELFAMALAGTVTGEDTKPEFYESEGVGEKEPNMRM